MKNIEMYEIVGERIHELRIMNKYTKQEFADMVGISARYLYNIEHGKQGISVEILLRISEILDVSCDYILTGREKFEKRKEFTDMLRQFTEPQISILVSALREMQMAEVEK